MFKYLSYILFLLIACFSLLSFTNPVNRIWKIESGTIHFLSDAPLEIIEASSSSLQGLIDPNKRTFAFLVDISSFEGFNSPLQRQHFNENYLERNRFPNAIFKGRIIEKVDLERDGTYTIRAKGMLNIHGIEQERIIKSEVVIAGGELRIRSFFTVPLDDHRITIPQIVNQKIAEDIQVNISAVFQQIQQP